MMSVAILHIVLQLLFIALPIFSYQVKGFSEKNINVLLTESEGYNDEVWLAFAQALSSLKHVQTTISLAYEDINISPVLNNFQWFNQPQYLPFDNLKAEHIKEKSIKIYISTTCDQDILSRNEFFIDLFDHTSVSLFCIVHRADLFRTSTERFKNILPWIKANRIKMITLSEHVQQSLYNHLSPFHNLVQIDYLPPVFSIQPSILGREEFEILQRSDKTRKVVLQGTINHDRTNYTQIVKEMAIEVQSQTRISQGSGSMIILGKGGKVTTEDFARIQQTGELPFTEYFSTMSKSDVLLIGHRSKKVLKDEVSSSLAAALISGTPIVADQEFLQAYSYLLPDAVIQPKGNQTHLQAAFDYFSLPPLLHTRKRHAVTTLRKTILQQNKFRISQWLRT